MIFFFLRKLLTTISGKPYAIIGLNIVGACGAEEWWSAAAGRPPRAYDDAKNNNYARRDRRPDRELKKKNERNNIHTYTYTRAEKRRNTKRG